MVNIINGKQISTLILKEIQDKIEKNKIHGSPGLAVIQIGEKKESSIYIKKKREACEKVGIISKIYNLEDNITEKDICNLIEELNTDHSINGILIQLPIPKHLNESYILNKIDYLKDVDGFCAENIGNLALNHGLPKFIPCTPLGCIELLIRENITITGKHVVIIGKSNIVGLPMALLMMNELATVTVCHDKTENIKEHTKKADILISACGQAEMIKKDWLKEGVIVIDVGINPIVDETKKSGYRLVGDVDFDDVKEIASKITPVPGCVGPMTVAMLLSNTLQAFKYQNNIT
jgi:5,10-methylene-tetrahydrofolate dehydrogenase/methenyl tetrahydrofolate cyclohydrolase